MSWFNWVYSLLRVKSCELSGDVNNLLKVKIAEHEILGLSQLGTRQMGRILTVDRYAHLSRLGFWRLMQQSHFHLSLSAAQGFQRDTTQFEAECTNTGPTNHTVSMMHSLLLTVHTPSPCTYWSAMERDLGTAFSEEERDNILKHTWKASSCVRFQ